MQSTNLGYPDMWYYLNKKHCKNADLYEVYIIQFRRKWFLLELSKNGWPSSEWFDLKDNNDLNLVI